MSVHGRHRAGDAGAVRTAPRWSSWRSAPRSLIVIAFGIVEFGNAWNRKLEVETAARVGCPSG